MSSWIVKDPSNSSLSIFVDTTVYPLEVLFRTCYVFTDRCFLFLHPTDVSGVINVRFKQKLELCDLDSLAGEFSNELINQRIRLDIANETRSIRELIVAQAFAEADLLDKSGCEAGYIDDPKGISVTK